MSNFIHYFYINRILQCLLFENYITELTNKYNQEKYIYVINIISSESSKMMILNQHYIYLITALCNFDLEYCRIIFI